MIGERIREVRVAQQLSLTDVAGAANISVATLSRIENGKQGLDFRLFLALSRVLKTRPAHLLDQDDDEAEGEDWIIQRLSTLRGVDRVQFWKDLALARKETRDRKARLVSASLQIEELLAQIDYLREEVESFRKHVGTRGAARRPAPVERESED